MLTDAPYVAAGRPVPSVATSGVQVWIRRRAAEAAARAKFKRELAEAKRHEAIEQLKLQEAECELRAAEEEVRRLQRELTAPRDAHEDMARQELQRLLDEHVVMYNAPSDQIRCLTMLRKIATNVLSEPDNMKFRRIKEKNDALAQRVLSVRGGRAFLVAMGFVPTVIEFEQYFQLPGLEQDGQQVCRTISSMLRCSTATQSTCPPKMLLHLLGTG